MDTNDTSDTQGGTAVVDDFDAAFDAASADVLAPAAAVEPAAATEPTTDADTTDATDDAEPTAGESAAGEPTDDDGASDTDQQPAAEPAAAEPTKPAADQQLDPKFLAQAIAEAQAAREAEQARQQPAAEDKPLVREDFLSEAESAQIKKFETEWPDEYVAVQKLVQAELRAAIGNSFNGYTKQLNGVLAPLFGSVQKVEVNTYRGAVEAAHPDAWNIAPKVAEWIATQPSFVRGAYEAAYSKGTAQEAIELLSLYKQATGSTGAAPATPASSAAQDQPKPKPAADKKAVSALAAVPAAQRPKPQGVDVLDFDAAFAEAAQSLGTS